MLLSNAMLGNLAKMICGDSPYDYFYYRSSTALTSFFEELLLDYRHDGSTRKLWVQDVLSELNYKGDPFSSMPSNELVKVIEYLLHPDNFYEEYTDRNRALNRVSELLFHSSLTLNLDPETSMVSVMPKLETASYKNEVIIQHDDQKNANELREEAEENKVKLNKERDELAMKKIFISHSTKDRDFVIELVDLLESLGFSQNQIFCSSVPGYGIKLGEDFLKRLKSELSEEVLVLFILTENFYQSPICMCEMGATWVMTNNHIPIVVPPFDFSNIRGVLPNTQGIRINCSEDITSLNENLVNFFELNPMSFQKWERKRNRFIKSIDDLINIHK